MNALSFPQKREFRFVEFYMENGMTTHYLDSNFDIFIFSLPFLIISFF